MVFLLLFNKDWWEQAAHFEEWVLKNGVDAVKYNSEGKALNVDLVSGATMLVDDMGYTLRRASGQGTPLALTSPGQVLGRREGLDEVRQPCIISPN